MVAWTSVEHRELQLESSADEGLLRLGSAGRQQLAEVLEDWLDAYSGTLPPVVKRRHFHLVVELRRLLLSPDEKPALGALSDAC